MTRPSIRSKQRSGLVRNTPLALNNLGFAYSKQGRNDEAVELLKTALALDPNYVKTRGNLLSIYFRTGKYNEAIEQLALARIEPEKAAHHSGLGAAYMNTGQHLKAIDAFQRAVLLEPKDIQNQKNLGMARNLSGKKDDGIATFKQILLQQLQGL